MFVIESQQIESLTGVQSRCPGTGVNGTLGFRYRAGLEAGFVKPMWNPVGWVDVARCPGSR